MMQNEPRDEEKQDTSTPEGAAPAEPAEAKPEDGAPGPESDETSDAGAADDSGPDPLREELEETKNRLLRSLADIENMRRRHARELDEARKYAVTGFARELLDVADNLNRAIAAVPVKAREKIDLIRNLVDGVAMTEKMLLASFERHQISKVSPEPGEKFDHNRHQAMFEVPTDQHAPGSVAQVVAPGYVIADRLLRPAMVGVAKAVEPAAPDQGEAAERPDVDDEEGVSAQRPGDRVDTTA